MDRRWAATLIAASGYIASALLAPCRADDPAAPLDPLTLLNQTTQRSPQDTPDMGDLQRQLNAGVDLRTAPDAARIAKFAATLTDADVTAAINRGADALLKMLLPSGQFRPRESIDQTPWSSFAGNQQVGVVALALEALIEAGRDTGDPRLRPFSKEMAPAVNWLLAATTTQTYSAALQASALSLLPPRPEVRKALDRVRNSLIAGMREDGAYSYSLTNRTSPWDNSNTQYALLGVWDAADAGAEVPQRFWTTADAHWRQTQSSDGGWAYVTPSSTGFIVNQPVITTTPLPTLTVAGVASLYVALDHLHGGRIQPELDPALTRGLAAVTTDLRKHKNILGQDFYYAYGVERVGVASGLKYLGDINWFRHGAAAMLLSQTSAGDWSYAYNRIVGTSYALLFLAHGGSPVIFNKLQYAGEWNAFPRDDANLTRRIGRTLELPLNWQIISGDSDPSDWLDGPILLINGRGDPHFSPDLLAKLREYLTNGGMIFSTADDNDEAFTTAIRSYAAQVVDNRYTMRPLPADHPLFTLYEPVHNPPGLIGLSNGVRELWIHSPVDFAASWQTFAYSNKDHWTIPLNLYMYATGRKPPRHRLDTLTISAPATPPQRHLALAQLQYEGNADPEPGAWPRFARLLQRDAGTELQVQTTPIGKLDASLTPIAHLTGTDRLSLSDAQQSALRNFLLQGGTLIVDSAGGSEPFTQSFLDLAKALAPGSQIDSLPLDHPLFNGSLPASIKITRENTDYRKSTPPSRRSGGKPDIWVWSINNRPAIYFSSLDITSGLLGTHTWGISGYAPETAQALARDLLLYIEHARSTEAGAAPASSSP